MGNTTGLRVFNFRFRKFLIPRFFVFHDFFFLQMTSAANLTYKNRLLASNEGSCGFGFFGGAGGREILEEAK